MFKTLHNRSSWQLLTCMPLILAVCCAQATEYLLGVVPQQSSIKVARDWLPITNFVHEHSGIKIQFATAPSIPVFEKRLAKGMYDIAYMNPYHYVQYSKKSGYRAFAKARNKQIRGIIVVHKDSPIKSLKELDNNSIAFPSPLAFAATLLPRAEFNRHGIKHTAAYVKSHDSVYRNVAHKRYIAGGGVVRTLKTVSPDIASRLRILWTSKGYTPHAIAGHERVPHEDIEKILQALVELHGSEKGKKLLANIKISGFESAEDKNWNDIRALNIDTSK